MEQKLCVLIDFENLAAGTEKAGLGRFDIRAVMRRLKDKGRILVARSYGDWGRFAKFKQSMLEQGVSMMELTSYHGQEKNRADIALVVDAMELAYTRPYLDTFVLMSGDSDFTPLVMRLKELNKRVIGIGTRESTSRLLLECCDEFIYYRSLRKRVRPEREVARPASEPATAKDTQLTKEQAFELLVETLGGVLKESEGAASAGLVKQSMQRKEPAFDESEYGYPSFARFLDSARGRGLVRLVRDQKAGGYRVDLPEGAGEEDEPEAPPLAGAAADMARTLVGAGFDPTTHLVRHTVVEELVDHVRERQRRKKRNTLMYVGGDIARRCRKTEPEVPARQVRSVLNALREVGAFLHSDNNPVRSQSAHFTLGADAEELLAMLRAFYVRVLRAKGVALTDLEAISELLWGDSAHVAQVKEVLATPAPSAPKQPRQAKPAAPATAEPAAAEPAAAVPAPTEAAAEPAAAAPAPVEAAIPEPVAAAPSAAATPAVTLDDAAAPTVRTPAQGTVSEPEVAAS